MAKRIWLNKFRFYLRVGAIPFAIVGLILVGYPNLFFKSIMISEFTFNNYTQFFLRIIGIFLIYIYLTFEYMGSNPNFHRDLAFFQSILLFLITLLILISIFIWKFSFYLIIVSVYTLIFGIFLLVFASKNLLVRD